MKLIQTFGKKPFGQHQQKIQQSLNYRDNSFQNQHPTVMMAEGFSYTKGVWQFMNKPKDTEPSKTLPSIKRDLTQVHTTAPVITWFGHSSYLIQVNGKTILVDPVLSGNASPFSFTTKAFAGANVYKVDDFPHIDVLLLTHDHYDHLDYDTVLKLKHKTTQVCTSLGVSSHLVAWGYDAATITELDWMDTKLLPGGLSLTAAPARHFSGRGFVRGKTFWSSFVLKTPGHTLYLGGDSGYDTHFATIGNLFGPFDIALLECGQYNTNWPLIHMMPEQTVQAAVDLQAKLLLPVHWSKFSLALHPWDEPIKRVTAQAHALNVNITTPMIGEAVTLGEAYPQGQWWL